MRVTPMEEEETRRQRVALGRRFNDSMTTNDERFYAMHNKFIIDCRTMKNMTL